MTVNMSHEVRIQRLPHCAGLPAQGSEGAAGYDLLASISQTITLRPLMQELIPTGIAILPTHGDVAGLVLPRSGLGSRGLVLGNSVGLIDADYTGEIFVPMLNRRTADAIDITPGMRIAQLLFVPRLDITFVEIPPDEPLGTTSRGTGGFGSTGT